MNILLAVFDIAKFIPLIVILAIAAHQDHKTGEAKNKLWLYSPIGLTLTILELTQAPQLIPITIASIIIGTAISLLLFYTGAWGGADTKALITIALCTPTTPLITGIVTFTPIIVLTAASITALPAFILKRQKYTRFLPYILTGTIISLLL